MQRADTFGFRLIVYGLFSVEVRCLERLGRLFQSREQVVAGEGWHVLLRRVPIVALPVRRLLLLLVRFLDSLREALLAEGLVGRLEEDWRVVRLALVLQRGLRPDLRLLLGKRGLLVLAAGVGSGHLVGKGQHRAGRHATLSAHHREAASEGHHAGCTAQRHLRMHLGHEHLLCDEGLLRHHSWGHHHLRRPTLRRHLHGHTTGHRHAAWHLHRLLRLLSLVLGVLVLHIS